jgi:hypothetical protein
MAWFYLALNSARFRPIGASTRFLVFCAKRHPRRQGRKLFFRPPGTFVRLTISAIHFFVSSFDLRSAGDAVV